MSFKIIYKKVRDVTTFRNNHMEPIKITLAKWVNQALEQSLAKENIKSEFRVTCIWSFNSKAMDSKI